MKRFLALLYCISFFAITALVYAQTGTVNTVPVDIQPPSSGIDPTTSVGTILSNALTIIFVAAALVVLFMLIFGAFQWITSGGDKGKTEEARNRITSALVGLAIVAASWALIKIIAYFFGVQGVFEGGVPIPRPY